MKYCTKMQYWVFFLPTTTTSSTILLLFSCSSYSHFFSLPPLLPSLCNIGYSYVVLVVLSLTMRIRQVLNSQRSATFASEVLELNHVNIFVSSTLVCFPCVVTALMAFISIDKLFIFLCHEPRSRIVNQLEHECLYFEDNSNVFATTHA